jgi:hypothetical protein
MRLSDGLRQRHSDVLDRLQAMSTLAADEERTFDATESAAWDTATKEAEDLGRQIERQLAAEALTREGREAQPLGAPPRLVDESGRQIRLLTLKDKLTDCLASPFRRR